MNFIGGCCEGYCVVLRWLFKYQGYQGFLGRLLGILDYQGVLGALVGRVVNFTRWCCEGKWEVLSVIVK